jgi:hypothetical protein
MSITESYAERLERDLRTITEPLIQQLTDIDGEIESMTKELSELRAHRTRLVAIARQIDPERFGPKPKAEKVVAGKQTVKPEEIENVRTWLEANPPNGEGIWATRLSEDKEFREATKVRSGVIAQALAELHEQSFLTLDRISQGGGRIYKVVT